MRQNIAPVISPQRLKQLLVREILMMYLIQCIVRLYHKYKNHLKKVWIRLLT